MHLGCRRKIGGMCLLLGIKSAKVDVVPIDADPRHPTTGHFLVSSLQSTAYSFHGTSIDAVLVHRGFAKVFPSIVGAISVFMVDQFFRVSASHHLPNDARRGPRYAIYANVNSVAATRVSPASQMTLVSLVPNDRGRMVLKMPGGSRPPNKKPGFWVVVQTLAQVFFWRQFLCHVVLLRDRMDRAAGALRTLLLPTRYSTIPRIC